MGTLELFILALGLAMDAFAVSICKGLAIGKMRPRHAVACGLWFGGFQAGMPLVGYLLGRQFEHLIVSIDHWIAFVLLGAIGINMIREAFDEDEECNADVSPRTMLPLAVATSIDALAVGVTFAFLQVRIVPAVSFIGIVTFVFGAVGVKIGSVFGARFRRKAELTGGAVLILMGTKILLEHLGVIG